MKRVVRRWALISERGALVDVEMCHDIVKNRVDDIAASGGVWIKVPCTITYDDGKPRKKARKR